MEEKINDEHEDIQIIKEDENNVTTSRIPDTSTINETNETKPEEDNLLKEEKSKLFAESLAKAVNMKKEGNKYFGEGNYNLAEHNYQLGIDFVESIVSENIIHKKYNSEIFDKILEERVFLYSNLSNCYMKNLKYRESIETDIYIVTQLDKMWDKSYNRIIQSGIKMDNIMMANFYADTFKSMFNEETITKYKDTFNLLESKNKEQEEKMFKSQKVNAQQNKSANVNTNKPNVNFEKNKSVDDDKSDTKSDNISITESKKVTKKKPNTFSLLAKFLLSGFLIIGGGAIFYMLFNRRFTATKSLASK